MFNIWATIELPASKLTAQFASQAGYFTKSLSARPDVAFLVPALTKLFVALISS